MTPSLFEGTTAVDEYTFMLSRESREKLAEHRRTFIVEDDFRWLASHDVRLVRLPIGYWALADDEPYRNCQKELDWAMAMAEKYGIDMLLDVHGHPGSQNGYDHSGQVGHASWFDDHRLREKSVEAVLEVARRYRDHPRLWGVQVINEPRIGVFHFKLRAYYRQVGTALAGVLRPHTRIIFSDAFTPRLMSGAMKRVKHSVMMDVHLYHMTTLFTRWRSVKWFFEKTRIRRGMLARLANDQPILVGEWSGVLRGEKMKHVPAEQRDQLFCDYTRLQQAAFRGVSEAWTYWNYKTEEPGWWSFRAMVERGDIRLDEF